MALQILNRSKNANISSVLVRLLSSATEAAFASDSSGRDASSLNIGEKPTNVIQSFRTQENDPRKHTTNHYARLYTVPSQIAEKLYNPLPKQFRRLSYTFTETCLMIRKPFLEITSCINSLDFSKPAVRFVLYGEHGHGKSLTLAHILHYGYNSGFVLVHIPWVNSFIRRCKDVSPSESKPGMLDIPIDASNWLLHFKTQNEELLKDLNLVTSESYVWGLRENTPEGSHLMELIEFGITRSRYACDVIEVLLKEIKTYSTLGRCKTMVVIDGFNGLFSPFVMLERGRVKHNSKCTLTLPFLDITSFDWCNGVIILSVDSHAHQEPFKAESYLPRYLLGKEGWEHVDPFIPIKVGRYDEAEIDSIIDYYIDRQWIQHSEAMTAPGRAELKAISGYVPNQLADICAPL